IVGFMIKDKLGQPIYGINTHRKNQPMYDLEVGEEIEYFFSFGMNIGKGSYSISFSLSRSDSHLDRNYEWRDRGLMIHVVNSRKEDFIGSAWLNAQVDVTRHQQIQAVCE
ncbi:MAG: Wzt carbohydrate-binding domain-containing protein, partial [Pseudomonadales bacterium]|nr:Wzt carbohydrate-binding domain-containing protein [Pseudomonadales bacterium]